jgi:hypothetical protein
MGRFSARTENTLQRAGWYPGRQVPDKLAYWKSNETLSRFEMFPAAERILLEFGGLKVDQEGPGETCAREPFVVEPTFAAYEYDLFGYYSNLVKTTLYPLGEVNSGYYFWAIGEDNHVYILMDDIQLLGKDIDEALENLILGRKATGISPD